MKDNQPISKEDLQKIRDTLYDWIPSWYIDSLELRKFIQVVEWVIHNIDLLL